MKPANVFQLEAAGALASRRTLIMRLGLPLLIGLPFVLVEMPPGAKAAGLATLVMFLSFFGAAVALVRRRSEGHLTRLRLLPVPGWLVAADLLLAGALVDAAQMAPVLVLFGLVHGTAAGLGTMATAGGLLILTIVLLNLLGMLLAAAARSNPEVHLLGALCVGAIAFVSGLFPVPARAAALVGATSAWSPVWRLARTLEGLAGGAGDPGGTSAPLIALAIAVVVLWIVRAVDWGEALRRKAVDKSGPSH